MSRRKSSSFTISWPLILALIFGYNFLFDNDDESTVEVQDQPAVVSVEEQSPALEDKLKEVGKQLKDVGENVLVIVKDELESRTEEPQVEVSTNDTAQDIEEEKEETPAEEIPVVEKSPEPLETEDQNTGMKKL